MNENKLCKYCLVCLTGTDASSDFCSEKHRVDYSGTRWLMLFMRIDAQYSQPNVEADN